MAQAQVIDGFGYPKQPNPIVQGDEPNRINCQFCQFPCDTNRDAVCPYCGSPDYRHFGKD